MAIFGDFSGPAFAASRVLRLSDLHSKFALGPHHVALVDTQPAVAEIRRGKKDGQIEYRRMKLQGKNIRAAIINDVFSVVFSELNLSSTSYAVHHRISCSGLCDSLPCLGDAAFVAVGPRLWKSLLTHVRRLDLYLDTFRRKLKTYCTKY